MPPMRLTPNPERSIVVLAAVTLVTITVMTILLLGELRVHELRHAEGETLSLSRIIADQTARSLQSVDLALDVSLDRLAQAEKLGISVEDPAIHMMLRSRAESMPQLRSMFIVDADGKIASSALSHPAPSLSVKDRDYFTVPRDRSSLDRYVSSPAINRVDGKRTLFFSRRIQNAKGEFAGVIAASLDLAYFETLYDSIKLDAVGPISLHLSDGTLVARAPHDESLMAGAERLPALEHNETERTQFKTVRKEGADAGITTYRQVSQFPVILGVATYDRDALKEWRGTAGMLIAAAAVNVLLVLAAMTLLLRKQRREAALAAAARESDEHLRAMVNSVPDAIVTVDSEQRVVVFNPAAERMFGYGEEQMRGSRLDTLLPERFRAEHEDNVAAYQRGGVTARMKKAPVEIIGRRADGAEFPIESTITQVTIEGRALYTAILRDISERRRAENDLRESHDQLRELASSLQAVREQERIMIARELHDELGQQLLRLRMDLSWVSSRIKDMPPALQDKVADMKTFVAGTVDTLRHVTTQLRPPLLDDLGLADAARWQLDQFAQRTGIAVNSTIAVDGIELDERTSINVFRMLQESLTNVARHADATEVKVSLTAAEKGLVMEIRDNGRGAEFGEKQELGHGLVGIRERTVLLGGRMEIASIPGQGFTVGVHIPLDAPNSAREPQ